MATGFYLGWSFAAAILLVVITPLLWGDNSVTDAHLVIVGVVWALFLLPVPFVRCRLTADSVYVRNYFRSYSFGWSEVASVELVPAGFLTVDTSWSAYPRIRLTSGEHVHLRAAIHLRKKRAEQFVRLVEDRANAFEFRARISAQALTN